MRPLNRLNSDTASGTDVACTRHASRVRGAGPEGPGISPGLEDAMEGLAAMCTRKVEGSVMSNSAYYISSREHTRRDIRRYTADEIVARRHLMIICP